MNVAEILARLRRSQLRQPGPPQAWSRWPWVMSGFETHHDGDGYYWDGLKRYVSPQGPFVVFQYTLEGEGVFETPQRAQRLTQGSCFFAHVPSRHVYYLPKEARPWTFYWVMISHPYVVERLTALTAKEGFVWEVAPGSLLSRRSVDLLESSQQRAFSDEFSEEAALFEWLVECEREAAQKRVTEESAVQLRQVREMILGALPIVLGVPEIANHFGMSRTHFSHHFREIAGVSPGRFGRDLRLQVAVDLLRQSREPIKEVANKAGFPDVPTLHKAIRRRYGFTPQQLRRPMEGSRAV